MKEEEPLISKHDIAKCRISVSHKGLFTPGVETRQYPLSRRLVGRQNRPESCGEEKNLLLLLSIKPRFLGRPVRLIVIIPIYLFWLVLSLTLYKDIIACFVSVKRLAY
jgi:hypothetical protein